MKYKALILDLDGTLYYQLPVRLCMMLRLCVYYILRPYKVRELFLLRKYRKLREKRFSDGSKNFEYLQVKKAAELYGMTLEDAQRTITSWMIYKPLNLLKLFRRRKLLDAVKRLHESGTIIIVYSDYPVKEKLSALGLKPDYAYCSTDKIVKCMKPDSEGLLRIINISGVDKKDILYVGDRYEKDGLCACGAGIDYLDVKVFVRCL